MTTALEKRPWARNPWRYLLWAVPAALLATPAVMMLRGAEGWLWGPLDFVFAAILLFGSTAMIDLAIRRGGSTAYRLGAALAVLVSFLLVWINAAVGVIGDEDNPANLLFFAVILVALAGAALARFESPGMARAMAIASAFTVAIAAAIIVLGWGATEPPGAIGLVVLIGGFAALWALSSALFAKAAREAGPIERGSQ